MKNQRDHAQCGPFFLSIPLLPYLCGKEIIMRRFQVLFVLFALIHIAPLEAKTSLRNSQHTFASACLADEASSNEMIDICETALSETGASLGQRQQMRIILGDALYDMDLFERSEAKFNEVLSANPEHYDALRGLGWIAWSKDDFETSAGFFTASVSALPTAEGLAGLASSYRHAELKDVREIIQLLDLAVAMSSEYIWAIREKAWALVDADRDKEAEAVFRRALEKDPENAWTLYGLGYTLNKLDQWSEAAEVLSKALKAGQDIPSVYSQRSLAYYKLGKNKLAFKDAETYIAARPDRASGYVRKARALEAMGKREIAIYLLEERLTKGHNDFAAFWLADLYYNEEDYATALDTLNQIFVEGKPDFYDHRLRALLALELEDRALAHADIAKALELRPDASYPRYYKALLLVQESKFDEAENWMDAALESGLPEHQVKHFLSALASRGEYVRAISWRLKYRTSAAAAE